MSLVEAMPMNESKPNKQAPVLKDISKCQKAVDARSKNQLKLKKFYNRRMRKKRKREWGKPNVSLLDHLNSGKAEQLDKENPRKLSEIVILSK